MIIVDKQDFLKFSQKYLKEKEAQHRQSNDCKTHHHSLERIHVIHRASEVESRFNEAFLDFKR